MAPKRDLKEVERELEELKKVTDGLYKQHAHEKAQMQGAIEREKLRNEQVAKECVNVKLELDQTRDVVSQMEEEKKKLEEKIQLLEESCKNYSAELVNDLEEIDQLKTSKEQQEETIRHLQKQINLTNDRFTQLCQEYDLLQNEKKQILEENKKNQEHLKNKQKEIEKQMEFVKEREVAMNKLQEQIDFFHTNLQLNEKDHAAQLVKIQQEIDGKNQEMDGLKHKMKTLENEIVILSMADGSKGSNRSLSAQLLEIQQQLFLKGEELVQQAEKTLIMAQKYEQTKEKMTILKENFKQAREFLLKGIAGEQVDESNYQHVSLEELVRLRMKAFEHEWMLTSNSNSTSGGNSNNTNTKIDHQESTSTFLSHMESNFSMDTALGTVGKLERELRLYKSRHKKVQDKNELLEKELEEAIKTLTELQNLKEKAVEMAGRERIEKEMRTKTEQNVKQSNEKIIALSEHIEKLMVHLKHEAAAKSKAIDAQKRTEKELAELRERSIVLTKKNQYKDQQIAELQQGSKILEDQLRLMDEKFIEVRNKLDFTRNTFQKENKKLQNELNTLRMKWQLASDAGLLNGLTTTPNGTIITGSSTGTDWTSIAKLNNKSKGVLGASASESRLGSSGNNGLDGNYSFADTPPKMSPPGKQIRFEIPKLPQSENEIGTPWSDNKLNSLQRQLQDKRRY